MKQPRKRLTEVRIDLPKGLEYEILEACAELHGAPALSRYILTAALSYSTAYLKEKAEECKKKKEESSD